MIHITYTNGDIQNIKVTGDFFSMTLAPKDGKQVKITPIQKAEALAFDLADARGGLVSNIALFYPGNPDAKMKVFRPVDEKEVEEKAESTPAFLKELKAVKREWKHKRHTQHWKWTF